MRMAQGASVNLTGSMLPSPAPDDNDVGLYLVEESDKKDEEVAEPATKVASYAPKYTVFSKSDKYVLIFLLLLIGWWLTLLSPIYFPALPTLTHDFHTTPEVMNLSVMAYLLAQGIFPTFMSAISDTYGRRVVIVTLLAVYVAACIALSQTNVYWLLAFLRCIQAAGIAPVIAICAGVSGDICTPHNRAGFVGLVTGGQLLGNGLGGLVGAALISRWHTWRSIFVFLAIGGGVTLVITGLLLPETLRLIVGNGLVKPRHWFQRLLQLLMPCFLNKLSEDSSTLESRRPLNILEPLRIFFRPGVLAVLFPAGLMFASWTMVLTLLLVVLETQYGYSVMKVGLIYLPQGVLALASTIVMGRCMNWYYRRKRDCYDRAVARDPMAPRFNPLRTRIDMCIVPAFMNVGGLVIFGWCVQYHQSIASIIVSTIMVSALTSGFMVAISTMLVDFFPGRGLSATSCLNLMRCWLAAMFSAVLDFMLDAMNYGGTYTFMAGIYMLALVIMGVYILHYTKHLEG